jgi:hypothetical protein
LVGPYPKDFKRILENDIMNEPIDCCVPPDFMLMVDRIEIAPKSSGIYDITNSTHISKDSIVVLTHTNMSELLKLVFIVLFRDSLCPSLTLVTITTIVALIMIVNVHYPEVVLNREIKDWIQNCPISLLLKPKKRMVYLVIT